MPKKKNKELHVVGPSGVESLSDFIRRIRSEVWMQNVPRIHIDLQNMRATAYEGKNIHLSENGTESVDIIGLKE